MQISSAKVRDIRFPTSTWLDGSDAMNPAPDYSLAYVELQTTNGGPSGYGFTFTIGRGNELCVLAAERLARGIVGRSLDGITADMGRFWADLTGDSQLRWVGPEKGVIHLAAAAIVNAVWDLWARQMQRPVWRLAAELEPEHLARCIDFRAIGDVVNREEATELFRYRDATIGQRLDELEGRGFPAYTTSAGWLGYSDEKIEALCRQAIAQGWNAIKLKVGADPAADRHRCDLVRDIIGFDRLLMIDANQVWETEEAIVRIEALSSARPYWIEEPVHPDDILGHARVREAVRPVKVATGEHVPNRVLFKQLLKSGAVDVIQPDACRLGGLNEALAVMAMAQKFNVPICPHAGGVGLCGNAQHLSMIDYLRFGGSLEGRMTEYTDHLHEHFNDPVVVENGRYRAPDEPGFSAELRAKSVAEYEYPGGHYWSRKAA